MTDRLTALSIALVLLLLSVPIISLGTTNGQPAVWGLGLAALGLGALIPPARRLYLANQPSPDKPPQKQVRRCPGVLMQ